MAKLALRHCTPVKNGTKPITAAIAHSLLKQLSPKWNIGNNAKVLEQEFRFRNFHETVGFVNAVAWIANTENHHPNMEVGYDLCKISYTTHAAKGLTVNDFICAAKIDAIHQTAAEEEKKIRPAQQPRPQEKTAASAAKNLQLNMDEAEQLLSKEIKIEIPAPISQADDYEIELKDPDEEPTQPHLHNPEAGGNKTRQPPETGSVSGTDDDMDEVITNQEHGKIEGQDSMPTVILPPGLPRTPAQARDNDEEATIIVPPAQEPDIRDAGEAMNSASSRDNDPDEVKTMIMTEPKADIRQPEEEEEDEDPFMKTMIMKPPVFGSDHDSSNPMNAEDNDTVLMPVQPDSPGKKGSG